MDLGINQIIHEEGTFSAPLGVLDRYRTYSADLHRNPRGIVDRFAANRVYDLYNTAHPFTGIHVTEKGLELLEKYVTDVRSVIGYEVPLAVDHFGHIGVEDCIKLSRRIEKYNLAWLEDMIPWQYTDQYVRLSRASTTPICTGEDIYLKEGFRPLLEAGAVSVIHPDVLSAGGIMETKKIGDLAQDHGVAMALHMAESPIACLAAAHVAVATENFLALEFHSVDVPWWDDLVSGPVRPIVDRGWITPSEAPGLGIESLRDEVIREHLSSGSAGIWRSTDEWDAEFSHDRTWS